MSTFKFQIASIFFVLILTSGCIGRSTPPTCPTTFISNPVASQDFVLSARGGAFTYGTWTFTAAPDALDEDAELRVEDRTGSDLHVSVPHLFTTVETSQRAGVVTTYPASNVISPLRLIARKPVNYKGLGRIVATLNNSQLPVHDLTVMQSATQLLEPDFSSIPTATSKSFVVEPAPASLVSEDTGWLYTLAHELEESIQCVQQSIAELAKQLGDRVGDYVDDPCMACQSIADAVVNVEKCQTLVNNLGTTLCDAFLAEKAKESWTNTILNWGCKGATWLDFWVHSFAIELATGTNPVEAICANAENLKKFLDQYKIHSDCMCDLFIRDPRCKDTTPNQDCSKIWAAVIGANPNR